MANIPITITANAAQDIDQYVFTINSTNCNVSGVTSEGIDVDLDEPVLATASDFYIQFLPTSGYIFNTAPTLTDGTHTLTAEPWGVGNNYRLLFSPADPWGENV